MNRWVSQNCFGILQRDPAFFFDPPVYSQDIPILCSGGLGLGGRGWGFGLRVWSGEVMCGLFFRAWSRDTLVECTLRTNLGWTTCWLGYMLLYGLFGLVGTAMSRLTGGFLKTR